MSAALNESSDSGTTERSHGNGAGAPDVGGSAAGAYGTPPPRRLLSSAGLLAGGNVASRLLGLVRESVIAGALGGSLEASAFRAAARVPTLIYDLLVGGMLSAALVPVLAAYGARDRREFWRAASTLVSAAAAVCGLAAVIVYAGADAVAAFLAESRPDAVPLIATSLRFIAPAVFLFGVGGVLTGVLYAMERFKLPALTGALYNAGFIAAALLLWDRFGFYALASGITLGATAQVLVLAPGLRGANLRPTLRLRHPALKRVLVLYVPIAFGLVVSMIQGVVEPRLAFRWGDEALGWMAWATSLIQFPHGLVAMAIAAAILPRLSAQHAREEESDFSDTLARGLRAVLALIVPAAAGLAVLADPVVGVVFQRYAFVSADRAAVAMALHGYLIGLPFAAVDWPLNYAFYARQNTIVPAAVGVLSIAGWFAVALALPQVLARAIGFDVGFLGLVLADSVKHALHAAVMMLLMWRLVGADVFKGVAGTALKASVASAVMAVVVWQLDQFMAARLEPAFVGWLARALVGGTVGLLIYAGLAYALRLEEVGWLFRQVRRRVQRPV